MIEIRITDPSKTSKEDLQKIVTLLEAFLAPESPQQQINTISIEDNPATGAPDECDTKKAFGERDVHFTGHGMLDPVAAFGPNVAGGAPSIADAATPTIVPVAAPTITTPPSATLPVPNIASLPPALPTAPAVPPVVPPPENLAQIDKNGLPWDARIHSETRSMNKDGTWRNKRGVDPALIAHVEAELRGVPTPPTPAEAFGAIPPTMPPLQDAIPAPSVSNAAPLGNYLSLVQKVTAARAAGKLTDDEIKTACLAVGIPNGAFPLLVTKPDLVPAVDAQITTFIAARG